jgi:hypothetical protein
MTEDYINIPSFLRREVYQMPKLVRRKRYCQNGPWKGQWITLSYHDQKTMKINIGGQIGYYSADKPIGFNDFHLFTMSSCFWHPANSVLS